MRQAFILKRFSSDSLEIIDKANSIINLYLEQGYSLSLRQLYYQFVSKGFIPNTMKDYKRLGSILNDARLAGEIDWEAISDRTRSLSKVSYWDNPWEILSAAISQYRIDKWVNCENYVEVWVEKEALIDIVQQTSQKLDVSCFACRGYVSQSSMYEASLRFIGKRIGGKDCTLLYIGDHDPSGIDMTRDIQARLLMFQAKVEVIRIALNMDQIEKFNPPPNPAKLTDSRCKEYISNFGRKSWEVDALPPEVISDVIFKKISHYLDMEEFNARVELEDFQKNSMYFCISPLRYELED